MVQNGIFHDKRRNAVLTWTKLGVLPCILGKEYQNLGLEKGQEKLGILSWQKSGNPVYINI